MARLGRWVRALDVRAPMGYLEALVLVVTGGPVWIAAVHVVQLAPDDPLWLWFVWWTVVVAAVLLFARGLVGLAGWSLSFWRAAIDISFDPTSPDCIYSFIDRSGQPTPAVTVRLHVRSPRTAELRKVRVEVYDVQRLDGSGAPAYVAPLKWMHDDLPNHQESVSGKTIGQQGAYVDLATKFTAAKTFVLDYAVEHLRERAFSAEPHYVSVVVSAEDGGGRRVRDRRSAFVIGVAADGSLTVGPTGLRKKVATTTNPPVGVPSPVASQREAVFLPIVQSASSATSPKSFASHAAVDPAADALVQFELAQAELDAFDRKWAASWFKSKDHERQQLIGQLEEAKLDFAYISRGRTRPTGAAKEADAQPNPGSKRERLCEEGKALVPELRKMTVGSDGPRDGSPAAWLTADAQAWMLEVEEFLPALTVGISMALHLGHVGEVPTPPPAWRQELVRSAEDRLRLLQIYQGELLPAPKPSRRSTPRTPKAPNQ